MPARKRLPHTEAWEAIQQLCLWPEQKVYEILRPCVLFGDPPGERAEQTKANERTIRRQADRFEVEGMVSLFRPTKHQETDDHRSLPPPMRQALVDLRAEYPDFSLRELAQICFVQFGRRPSHHTIKQVLADGPKPSIKERRYTRYADISEPFQRRLAVVKLHTEGWMPTTIAKYLGVHHSTVYEALNRFRDEGFAGLDDKSRANKQTVRKVNIATRLEIRKIQENPEIGAFRIRAKLKQMGITLSRATVGRIMAENRKLYGLGKPATSEKKEPKEHPFKARFRHEIWSVDVRYIEKHRIPGITGPFYVISILENFSRAILASDIFQRQDLTAYLMVLYAAIQQHGCPRMLVSDSGGIFKANQAKQIYKALGIEKKQIEKRQSWQDLIESQFNIQRRLADYHWSKAETWEQAKAIHAQWMSDHNYQDHWAHKDREDGRLSPAEVLGWVRGIVWEPERVHRVFFSHQFKRALDRFGCVRFRHFRLYGEEGLSREQATLWLYGETLTLEFNNTPLTQFQVTFQPDKKHFKGIDFLQRFETQYRSMQASLWEEEEVQWLKVLRLPEYAGRHRQSPGGSAITQLPLFA